MWIILSKTRKKCWIAWAVLAPVPLLLLLLMTLNGKFEGMLGEAWGWWAFTTLPALTVFLAATLLHRIPAKVIAPTAHTVLLTGSWAYLSLLLFTLLAVPFAERSGMVTLEYLSISYCWLVPLHLLLAVGYFFAFWKKNQLRPPDAGILSEMAGSKAGSNLPASQRTAYASLAAGDFGAVLAQLSAAFEATSPSDLQDVVLLQSQHSELSRDEDLGLVEPDTAQRQRNRIAMALLNIVPRLSA